MLEGIILEFQKINQQAPKDYEQMLNMLRKIKAEFHIDDYTFWQIKPTYEVYLLNEVLKIYVSMELKNIIIYVINKILNLLLNKNLMI